MNDTMIPPDFKSEVYREKRKKKSSMQSYFFPLNRYSENTKMKKKLYLKTCSNCCFLETKIDSDTFEKK